MGGKLFGRRRGHAFRKEIQAGPANRGANRGAKGPENLGELEADISSNDDEARVWRQELAR